MQAAQRIMTNGIANGVTNHDATKFEGWRISEVAFVSLNFKLYFHDKTCIHPPSNQRNMLIIKENKQKARSQR